MSWPDMMTPWAAGPEPDADPLRTIILGGLIARARLKRDGLTRAQVQVADDLAEGMQRHFSAEEIETAGRALLIAAASCATLAGSEENIPAAVVVNILGFTAARMVADGRAWLGAQGGTP